VPNQSIQLTAFEDLPGTVGRIIEGEPFSLSAEDIDRFHQATWLDKAYPEGSVPEFPETLIEGFHLLSMVDAVARFAAGAEADLMWGLNYGLDRVRFVNQVHHGDRILPTFETLEVIAKGEGFKILRRCTFTVEGSDSPAMVADWWGFALPRGAEI
jgi:acyl dehydratase